MFVVSVLSDRVKRQTRSYVDEQTYITAELPAEDLPESFIIGDNKMYGGYLNRPLGNGVYNIRMGFRAVQIEEMSSDTYVIPGGSSLHGMKC